MLLYKTSKRKRQYNKFCCAAFSFAKKQNSFYFNKTEILFKHCRNIDKVYFVRKVSSAENHAEKAVKFNKT